MKPLIAAIIILAATTAHAQDFVIRREIRADYSYSYDSGVWADNYGRYGVYQRFPLRRYQYYEPQVYYPANWGAIPGYYTNGYFIPGW